MRALLVMLSIILSVGQNAGASLPCANGNSPGEMILNTLKGRLASKGVRLKSISYDGLNVVQDVPSSHNLLINGLLMRAGNQIIIGAEDGCSYGNCLFAWAPAKPGAINFANNCKITYMPNFVDQQSGTVLLAGFDERPRPKVVSDSAPVAIPVRTVAAPQSQTSAAVVAAPSAPPAPHVVGSSCSCMTKSDSIGDIVRTKFFSDGTTGFEYVCANIVRDRFTFNRSCEGAAPECNDRAFRCPHDQ